MRLTILYDNVAKEGFRGGHGFSCLVEDDRTMLVDTGWDGYLLLSNMKKLGVDCREIDSVFLSHSHWDHIGGLPTLLNCNNNLEVFYPGWFSKNLKREVEARARLIEVSAPTQIAEETYTTGELGKDIKEQSLILRSAKGNLIVTGCSHPGLGLILNNALNFGKVYGVIGGFHGFEEFSILEGIPLIVPCHCTRHKEKIKDLYPENCDIGYVGKIIEI